MKYSISLTVTQRITLRLNVKNWFKSNTIRYFALDEWKDNNRYKNCNNRGGCYGFYTRASLGSSNIIRFREFDSCLYACGMGRQSIRYYRQDIISTKEKSSISNYGSQPFFTQKPRYKRYNLLVENIFAKLLNASSRLDLLPFYAVYRALELHFDIDSIINSPYYSEARIFICQKIYPTT